MNDRTEIAEFRGSPLVPRTMEELLNFSKRLAMSELVPKDFQGKDANIFVAIEWGMEIGLQPMQALQSIAVINGRPSLWGDAGLALVYASGLCESFEEEITAESATCRTKRKGNPKETVRTFTKEDATKAELWGKGTYAKYPKRMLQMRARWWALRDAYTDVLRGVTGAEELVDVEIEVNPPPATPGAVEQPRARSDKPAPVDAEIVKPEAAAPKGVDRATGEVVDAGGGAPAEPSASTNGNGPSGKPLGEGQLRIVRAKLKHAALTETDLVAAFGALEGLRFEQFDDIQEWIARRATKVAG